MVRAYERLKKEGLVKHLAISQHHYNNIQGDMAWDILDYLAEHQPYDATQFFYTYNDRKEVQRMDRRGEEERHRDRRHEDDGRRGTRGAG